MYRALVLAAFELQKSNSHLERAVLVAYSVGRRGDILGMRGLQGAARLFVSCPTAAGNALDHMIPSHAASSQLTTPQTSALLLCPDLLILSGCLFLEFLLPPCLLLVWSFSLLPPWWQVLFLFNGTNFSEGSGLYFK